MILPTIETLGNILTIIFALFGGATTLFWASLVIWAFRDMRLRSRDPFAQILAALLVAAIPFVGILAYLILRPPETLTERYERALEEEALLQEIESRPRCHSCTRIVKSKWVMCPSCHTELKKVCIECNHLLELGWTRCPFCTAAQPDESEERPRLTPSILGKVIQTAKPENVTNHHPVPVPSTQLPVEGDDDNPTVSIPPILLPE